MRQLISVCSLMILSGYLFSQSTPQVVPQSSGQSFTNVINESRSFFESSSVFPPGRIGRYVEITFSLIKAGTWDAFHPVSEVLSTNCFWSYDTKISYPGVLLPPNPPKKEKINHYGGKGKLISTKDKCDDSKLFYYLVFPTNPSSQSPNKLLIFNFQNSTPMVYYLTDNLEVKIDQEIDYGTGILPSKSYIICGFIENQNDSNSRYFFTMKIVQKYGVAEG